MIPSFSDLIDFVEYALLTWGIWIVPLGAFLENTVILGFIFPGATVIFLSGFVARGSGQELAVIIALAAVGSFAGDNFDYFIGRRTGRVLVAKPLFAKPVALVEPFLAKHGIWAIFAGRFSGWSRAWVALTCGIVRYSYFKFALVSFVSAVVWTSAWIIGGYLLGGERELIEEWLSRISLAAWLAIAVVLIYYFRTRIKLVLDLGVFLLRKYGVRIKNGIKGDV